MVGHEQTGDPVATSPITARTSRFLGTYEILGEVARGGMGVVYRARQVHLNRIVALKLVRDPALASFAELRRFRAEAEAVARLDHPNIVPIYEVGQVEDQPYFSMKLIEGGNLSGSVTRLKEDSRAAAALMAKVARAVHFAHQRAILHRDIKPSNILLGEDDEPFVTDFGLAKRIGPDSGTAATVTGVVMGTPAYMPPEQARGGTKSVTTAADVYSLGATLYETVTGQPPYTGDSVAEILRRVLDEPPARPRTLNTRLDRDLETICLKCLEKEPAGRYGSAEALAEDLECWLEGRPITARPASARERAVKWVRRHRTLAALIAVSVMSILCVGVGGILFTLKIGAALGSAEDRLYVAEVNLARRDLDAHHPGLAGERLEKHRPSREIDRRGFEWFFLQRLALPVKLHGHTGKIASIAFHPNLPLLASGGDDRTIRIWDLVTGTSQVLPANHSRRLQVLAFSPDGKWMAAASDFQMATIWSVAPSGFQLHRRLSPLAGKLEDISFSFDSSRLGLVFPGQVRVEDVESGQGFSVPDPTTGLNQGMRGRALAFSPDGRAATIAQDNRGGWRGRALASSPDGRRLAVSRDQNILIRKANTGELVKTLSGHKELIKSLAWNPDGQQLASSSEDGTIRLWDVAAGKQQNAWSGHAGMIVNRVVFSPEGKTLASAGLDQQAKIWDVASGRELRAFHHPRNVEAVAFHPDGTRLATAGDDAVIRIWDISGIESTQLSGHRGAVVGVAVRPDGSQIASIASDNSLGFWTVQSELKVGQPLLVALPFVPTAIAYGRDGRYLATAGSEGKVQIRDSFTGLVVQTINEPEITILGMAFSPDGGSLATVGMEGSVIVWHWKEPRIARELRGHKGTVKAIAYSPDGRRLATAGGDRIVRLWDSATGRLMHSLLGHSDFVNGLAFSPDGRFLASAGEDHAIRLWDLFEWSLASTPMNGRHSEAVLGLAFSPGRRRPRLASASADRTVKLWDTATFLETLTLSEHTDQVMAVAFGPDGRFLVSAGREGTLRVWNATEDRAGPD